MNLKFEILVTETIISNTFVEKRRFSKGQNGREQYAGAGGEEKGSANPSPPCTKITPTGFFLLIGIRP